MGEVRGGGLQQEKVTAPGSGVGATSRRDNRTILVARILALILFCAAIICFALIEVYWSPSDGVYPPGWVAWLFLAFSYGGVAILIAGFGDLETPSARSIRRFRSAWLPMVEAALGPAEIDCRAPLAIKATFRGDQVTIRHDGFVLRVELEVQSGGGLPWEISFDRSLRRRGWMIRVDDPLLEERLRHAGVLELVDAGPPIRHGSYCRVSYRPAAQGSNARDGGTGFLTFAVSGRDKHYGRITSEKTRADVELLYTLGKINRRVNSLDANESLS